MCEHPLASALVVGSIPVGSTREVHARRRHRGAAERPRPGKCTLRSGTAGGRAPTLGSTVSPALDSRPLTHPVGFLLKTRSRGSEMTRV